VGLLAEYPFPLAPAISSLISLLNGFLWQLDGARAYVREHGMEEQWAHTLQLGRSWVSLRLTLNSPDRNRKRHEVSISSSTTFRSGLSSSTFRSFTP